MLTPVKKHLPLTIAANSTESTTLEGIVAELQGLMFPTLWVVNSDSFAEITYTLTAELNLGSDGDPPYAGVYTTTLIQDAEVGVQSSSCVVLGGFSVVNIGDSSTAAAKTTHTLAVTNTASSGDPIFVHLVLTGIVDQFIDPSRLPLNR